MGRQATDRRELGWVAREARTSVLVPGRARRTDGSQFDIVMHDISREGCRVECSDVGLEIGEWVEVEAAGLPLQPAQVRWALLGSAGLRFVP